MTPQVRLKQTWLPALVLALLAAGYLIFLNGTTGRLPERVATHFGADGQPNGWMTQHVYLRFMTLLGLGLAGLIAAPGLAIALWPGRIRLRVGAAQLAGRTADLSRLGGDLLWLACITLALVGGTHSVILKANAHGPARLPAGSFAALIAGFGVAIAGWIVLLAVHLSKHPEPPEKNRFGMENRTNQPNKP